MRKLLFAFLLIIVHPVFANDTLTRDRTFDFSVGDTFDYRHYNHTITFNNPHPTNITTISYSRYVITNIYYSLDSITKYIARARLYPLPVVYDTLAITHVSIYDLETFTSGCVSSMSIITDSQYHNRVVNIIIIGYNCAGSNHVEFVFADGLGITLEYKWGGTDYGGEYYSDSSVIIYYAKGSETWGTPYSDFTTGLQQLSPEDGRISLFPTVNDGTFNVKISDENLLPATLTVYDVLGREAKQLTLNNLNNIVNIKPCSLGMCLWKAVSKVQSIETGKMVVH